MDPITLAAGWSAATVAIKTCREVLSNCEDVSEISSHLNSIFHASSHAHAQEKTAKTKPPPTLIDKLLARSKETEEPETTGDSLDDAVKMTVGKAEHDAAIIELSKEINFKFPTPKDQPTTWDTILRTQSKLKAKRIIQRRLAEKRRLDKMAADREKLKNLGIEAGKLAALAVIGGVLVFGLIHLYNSGPIR